MTPLEVYLNGEYPNKKIDVSKYQAIIGSDNKYSEFLLQLFKALQTQAVTADCLAAYLHNRKEKWSKGANIKWMKASIALQSLNTFYIAHTKINDALSNVAKENKGVITVTTFNAQYSGSKNDSYDEVIMLLENGYNKFPGEPFKVADGPIGMLVRDE